jgi:MinD superfamily P-loop ATPase
MTYFITEKCVECGCCALFCKQHGILYDDGRYMVLKELCDGCGVCVEYCPIDDAIISMRTIETGMDA